MRIRFALGFADRGLLLMASAANGLRAWRSRR